MKKIILSLIFLLLLLSCRERNNIYDIGSDGFTYPPHIWVAWPIGGWYDSLGYLVGVRVEVNFTDNFEKSLPLWHEFYYENNLLTEFEFIVRSGNDTYYVDIFGPYVIGFYDLKIYFGDCPIGACKFEVTPFNDRTTLYGMPILGNSAKPTNTWFAAIGD